ncbi:MAG: hypothetical protein ACRDFB_03190 [Rhabdochlamydiaceae bacterium]
MTCNFYTTGKVSPQDQQTKATITVTDPNANRFSTSIDRVAVKVWSDSDKNGVEITAYETDVNSGIFKGTVTITLSQSTQDFIHVTDGDTLSAKYAATTPWSPDMTNRGITTTSFIGMTCPPPERVLVSGINLTDNEGNEQKTILANKQIQIGSRLSNITIRNQTFAYIVQIVDKDKNVESLSSVSGLLLPSQTFSPSVSWTPLKTGSYTVQIFVWQSINNPNSLSPPVLTDLTVLPSLSDYARSAVGNTADTQCQSGYELVVRSSNNSTVCASPDSSQKLIDRGWGHIAVSNSSLMHTGNACGQFYAAPDDPRDLRAVPVLLMNSNSTACVRLSFTIVSNYNDCNGPTCPEMFRPDSILHISNVYYITNGNSYSITPARDYTSSFKITVTPETIDLANYPIGSTFAVTYIIRPLSNATGFYDQSIPKIVCESYPLAVGYTANQVNSSDFSYINSANPPCPAGLYSLTGVEIAGMNYTEMKLP